VFGQFCSAVLSNLDNRVMSYSSNDLQMRRSYGDYIGHSVNWHLTANDKRPRLFHAETANLSKGRDAKLPV
jgi:hypothetical protein